MQLSKGVLKFQIRKAQQGDEHSIAKVHIQAWQETYQSLVPKDYLDNLPSELPVRVENWRKSLANSNRNTWVASIQDANRRFCFIRTTKRSKQRRLYRTWGNLSFKGI